MITAIEDIAQRISEQEIAYRKAFAEWAKANGLKQPPREEDIPYDLRGFFRKHGRLPKKGEQIPPEFQKKAPQAIPEATRPAIDIERIANMIAYGRPTEKPEPIEPQKYSEILPAFWHAITQSTAEKPAAVLRGMPAYTPGHGRFDTALENFAGRLESIKSPEKQAEAQKYLQGPLWPTQPDQPWYKIDYRILPNVLNTWAAQVGDQIPIMAMSILGRIAGKVVGTATGAAASVATGGIEPSDIATFPLVQKGIEHIGGMAPMVLMESGSFMENAKQLGIDVDIAEKYARLYGPAAGIIEYLQQLWNLKAFSRISEAMKKKLYRRLLTEFGGAVWEGFEELSQGAAERWLLGKAIDEQKERNPAFKAQKPKILGDEAKREFAIGLGIGGIYTGLGAGTAAAKEGVAGHIENTQKKNYLLSETGVAEIVEKAPELAKKIALKDKPSRSDIADLDVRMNEKERQQLAALIREAIAKKEQQERIKAESRLKGLAQTIMEGQAEAASDEKEAIDIKEEMQKALDELKKRGKETFSGGGVSAEAEVQTAGTQVEGTEAPPVAIQEEETEEPTVKPREGWKYLDPATSTPLDIQDIWWREQEKADKQISELRKEIEAKRKIYDSLKPKKDKQSAQQKKALINDINKLSEAIILIKETTENNLIEESERIMDYAVEKAKNSGIVFEDEDAEAEFRTEIGMKLTERPYIENNYKQTIDQIIDDHIEEMKNAEQEQGPAQPDAAVGVGERQEVAEEEGQEARPEKGSTGVSAGRQETGEIPKEEGEEKLKPITEWQYREYKREKKKPKVLLPPKLLCDEYIKDREKYSKYTGKIFAKIIKLREQGHDHDEIVKIMMDPSKNETIPEGVDLNEPIVLGRDESGKVVVKQGEYKAVLLKELRIRHAPVAISKELDDKETFKKLKTSSARAYKKFEKEEENRKFTAFKNKVKEIKKKEKEKIKEKRKQEERWDRKKRRRAIKEYKERLSKSAEYEWQVESLESHKTRVFEYLVPLRVSPQDWNEVEHYLEGRPYLRRYVVLKKDYGTFLQRMSTSWDEQYESYRSRGGKSDVLLPDINSAVDALVIIDRIVIDTKKNKYGLMDGPYEWAKSESDDFAINAFILEMLVEDNLSLEEMNQEITELCINKYGMSEEEAKLYHIKETGYEDGKTIREVPQENAGNPTDNTEESDVAGPGTRPGEEYAGATTADVGRGEEFEGESTAGATDEGRSGGPISGVRPAIQTVLEDEIPTEGLEEYDEIFESPEEEGLPPKPDDDIPFSKANLSAPQLGKGGKGRKPNFSILDEAQRLGVKMSLRAVLNGKNFLLADGTGVGKTMELLVVAYEYKKRTGKPVLIVSQSKTVIDTRFTEDAEKLGISIDDFETTTYSQLSVGNVPNKSYGLIIFDEAHNFKNPLSKKALAGMRKLKSEQRLYATATPFDRVWGAEYFLSEISGKPVEEIRKQLGYHIEEKYNPNTKEYEPKAVVDFGMNWSHVHRNILTLRDEAIRNGQMLRREYPFYGTLRPRYVRVNEMYKDLEERIWAYYEQKIIYARNRNAKKRLGGMRTNEMKRLSEEAKIDSLWEMALKDIQAGKDVIIVAGRYNESELKSVKYPSKAPLAEFEKRLKELNIPYARIYDDTQSNKTEEVRKFQKGDVRVVLMTAESGGVGIDLDDAVGDRPRVMYIDPAAVNYSGEKFDQLMGRISRRNTKSPAEVNIVIARNMSDTHTTDIIRKKMAALIAIQKGIDADEAYGFENPDTGTTERPGLVDYTEEATEEIEEGDLPEITGNLSAGLYNAPEGPVEDPEENNHPNPLVFGLRELVELAKQLTGTPLVKEKVARGATGDIAEARFSEILRAILIKGTMAIGPQIIQPVTTKKTGAELEAFIDSVKQQIHNDSGIPLDEIVVVKRKRGNLTKIEFLKRDPNHAARVLGHEIGHVVDWLPDETLKRGNILGHIAALKDFIKHTLASLPENQDNVPTLGDRKALMRQARETISIAYPKRLEGEQRKELIRQEYQRLIKLELENRGLYSKKEIMEELFALSKWWRPFDESEDPEYTKYRKKPAELYADAVSVLLNNPTALRTKAPKFYKMFFAYLDKRPAVRDAYDSIQDQMRSGEFEKEAVENLRKGFREGTRKHIKKFLSFRWKKGEFFKTLMYLFVDKHAETKRIARQEAKAGRLSPSENPLYSIEKATYTASTAEYYMDRIKLDVLSILEKAGLEVDDFEEYLFHQRVINERAELFNTRGWTKKTSTERLKEMERVLGRERYEALEKARKAFWKIRSEEIIPIIENSGMFDAETMEKIKNNEYYATFDVLKYIDQRYGPGAGARIYRQIGTFEDIAGPYESTLLKDISLIYAANWNTAKWDTIEMLLKTKEAEKAEMYWGGQYQKPKNPKEPGKAILSFMRNGKMEHYYVDSFIADAFHTQDPKWLRNLAVIMRVFGAPFKALFTGINPGFWTFNVKRDFGRALRNSEKAGVRKFFRAWIKAIKPAFRSSMGLPDKLVSEMLQANMLISVSDLAGLTEDDVLLERLVTMYSGKISKGNLWLRYVWHPFVRIGKALERIPKIAAYIYYTENFPNMSKEELAHRIRTQAGSPDFLAKGKLTPILNNLLLFSNPAIQGIRSDIEVMADRGKDFWWKMTKHVFIPKLLQWSLASGAIIALLKALGADDDDDVVKEFQKIKSIYAGVSEYNMSNYFNIPIGSTESGKTVYVRVPQDETGRLFGGLFHKMLKTMEGDLEAPQQAIHYAGSQLPNLHPAITAGIALWEYMGGQNPYDSFRGQHVVPDTEFQAKNWQTHKIFAKYLLKTLGFGVLTTFTSDNPDEIRSQFERMSDMPILSRWLTVSDYGKKQKLSEAAEEAKTERAREILKLRQIASKMAAGEKLTPEEESLKAENEEYLERREKISRTRRTGDVYEKRLLSASTIAEKEKILDEIIRIEGPNFDLTPYIEDRILAMARVLAKPIPMKKAEREEYFKERQEALDYLAKRRVSPEDLKRIYYESKPSLEAKRRFIVQWNKYKSGR